MGVAALPSPRKLAQILALKSFASAGSFFVDEKTRFRKGGSRVDNLSVIAFRSISDPTPVHRQMEPDMEMASEMPLCAPAGTAAASSAPFPVIIAKKNEVVRIPV